VGHAGKRQQAWLVALRGKGEKKKEERRKRRKEGKKKKEGKEIGDFSIADKSWGEKSKKTFMKLM
jgi:hypothetical protein